MIVTAACQSRTWTALVHPPVATEWHGAGGRGDTAVDADTGVSRISVHRQGSKICGTQ
jgi:hypothetical protein